MFAVALTSAFAIVVFLAETSEVRFQSLATNVPPETAQELENTPHVTIEIFKQDGSAEKILFLQKSADEVFGKKAKDPKIWLMYPSKIQTFVDLNEQLSPR